MASPIVKGQAFGATETVTAAKLQNIVDNSTFKKFTGGTEPFVVSGTEDIGTCVKAGGLEVKVNTGQLQIKDNGVTLAKMATQADQTVLGNVSGGTAVPTAVPIVGAAGILVNSDSLGTDDTKGATQGNIKAYVDAGTATQIGVGQTWQGVSRSAGVSYQNTTGQPIMAATMFTGSNSFQISTDNSSWVTVDQSLSGTDESHCQVIIPNNHYYKITGGGIRFWSELR